MLGAYTGSVQYVGYRPRVNKIQILFAFGPPHEWLTVHEISEERITNKLSCCDLVLWPVFSVYSEALFCSTLQNISTAATFTF